MEIRMELDKQTKGAVRYAEVNEDGERLEDPKEYMIGTLYIRKHAFAAMFPNKIEVSITAVRE